MGGRILAEPEWSHARFPGPPAVAMVWCAAMSDPRPLGRRVLVGFALLTGSALAAQVVVARLLASTLGYYFAFMLVSLTMLGLGSGALIVHARIESLRREDLERDAALLSILCGVSGCAGGLAYLHVYATNAHGALPLWLAPIFLCFFPFFLLSGTAVSLVLRHAGAGFHRAYAVDLLGAAGGAGIAVLLLSTMSPMEVLLRAVAVLPAVAGVLFALERRQLRLAAAGVAVAASLLGIASWAGRSQDRKSPSRRLDRPPTAGRGLELVLLDHDVRGNILQLGVERDLSRPGVSDG